MVNEPVAIPRCDVSIISPNTFWDRARSLKSDMEVLGWSAFISQSGAFEQINPVDIYYEEAAKAGRFFAIIVDQSESPLGESVIGNALHMLIFFSKFRPTVFLDNQGLLTGSKQLSERVIDIKGLGNIKIMDMLAQRWKPFMDADHAIEHKKEEITRRLGHAIDNIFSSTPMGFVFGPAEPENKDAVEKRTQLFNARRRIQSRLAWDYGLMPVEGEELVGLGLTDLEKELNFQIKEILLSSQMLFIIILCEYPGSIAEVAALSTYEELSKKSIIAIENQHKGTYVRDGSIDQSIAYGATVIEYEEEDVSSGVLEQLISEEMIRRYKVEASNRYRRQG